MSCEKTDHFYQWQQKITTARNERPPTSYASLNRVDDFADSMALYILNPQLLQAKCPTRYQFCEELIKQDRP